MTAVSFISLIWQHFLWLMVSFDWQIKTNNRTFSYLEKSEWETDLLQCSTDWIDKQVRLQALWRGKLSVHQSVYSIYNREANNVLRLVDWCKIASGRRKSSLAASTKNYQSYLTARQKENSLHPEERLLNNSSSETYSTKKTLLSFLLDCFSRLESMHQNFDAP